MHSFDLRIRVSGIGVLTLSSLSQFRMCCIMRTTTYLLVMERENKLAGNIKTLLT